MEKQETGLLGQATCGLCRKVFRFDPQTPISIPIDGKRQPACGACRSFADVWRAAFATAELPAEAEPVDASEPRELPRRRVVAPSTWD